EEAVVRLRRLLRPHLAAGGGVAHGEVLLEVGVDEAAAADGGMDAVLHGAQVALFLPGEPAGGAVESRDDIRLRRAVVLEDLGDDVDLPVVHGDRPRLPVALAQAAAPGLLAGGRVVSGDGAVVLVAGQVQGALAEQQRRPGDGAARQGPLLAAGRGVEGGQGAAAGEYDAARDHQFVVVPVGLGRGRLRPQRFRGRAVGAGAVRVAGGLAAVLRLVGTGGGIL